MLRDGLLCSAMESEEKEAPVAEAVTAQATGAEASYSGGRSRNQRVSTAPFRQ